MSLCAKNRVEAKTMLAESGAVTYMGPLFTKEDRLQFAVSCEKLRDNMLRQLPRVANGSGNRGLLRNCVTDNKQNV